LTKEQQNITFDDYIRWIEHGIFSDIVRLDILQLNDEFDRICNAALLSRNVNEAYTLITGFLTREQELSPTNQALLRSTHSRLSQLAEAGGWLPVRETETEQDTENCFPSNIFPPDIDRYLKSVAKSIQVAPEMAYSAALAAFALCMQGRYRVAHPSGNGHTEHLCLYMMIVAAPSERKTSTFDAVIGNILHEWQESRAEAYNTACSNLKADRRCIANQISSLEKRFKSSEPDPETKEKMRKLQKEYDELKPPPSPDILAGNTTPEAFQIRLKNTGENAGVFADEGGFINLIVGSRDRTPDIDVFLCGYNGSPCSVDRIGREPLRFSQPLISICLMVQPNIFEKFTEDKTLAGRGLAARFIFCKPASMKGKHDHHKADKIDSAAFSVYKDTMLHFLNQPQLSKREMPVLRFEQAAGANLADYMNQTDRVAANGCYMENEDAYVGKAAGIVMRIAGILHLLWERDPAVPISRETVFRAINLHRYYFIEKARSMHEEAQTELKTISKVKSKLLELTIQREKACTTPRDIQQALKGAKGLKRMEDFNGIFEQLESENILQIVKQGSRRVIYVSPHFSHTPESSPNSPDV
jgi:hypothetical protein